MHAYATLGAWCFCEQELFNDSQHCVYSRHHLPAAHECVQASVLTAIPFSALFCILLPETFTIPDLSPTHAISVRATCGSYLQNNTCAGNEMHSTRHQYNGKTGISAQNATRLAHITGTIPVIVLPCKWFCPNHNPVVLALPLIPCQQASKLSI